MRRIIGPTAKLCRMIASECEAPMCSPKFSGQAKGTNSRLYIQFDINERGRECKNQSFAWDLKCPGEKLTN